ncbi:hypothetical protein SAMN05216223_101277 [Actinacidiphila yanglinensis]|uniref:Uncharacterized protein n=1 Tax=Actinacidiphila yanglinensis TaxID=310779 RepID=A0A1H5SUC9_9ACTN|nr:hypothetical protein [Actinacidiphila yanglinensis]SEF54064.1 hypothetical protein SAMN05216223_101277 [Actinacidiphila yanglinensis]
MAVTRQDADGLARACQDLDDIRAVCVDAYGDDGAVRRLLAAVADRRDLPAPLHDLDAALVRAGDALGLLAPGSRGLLLREAAVGLHAADLARHLGLDVTGLLSPETGNELTQHLFTEPEPPTPPLPGSRTGRP